MLRKHALSQSQRLCKHLQRLQPASEVRPCEWTQWRNALLRQCCQQTRSSAKARRCMQLAHPAEQSIQAAPHSLLYSSLRHASTAAQLSSHDQTARPRLDVDAPLPRFVRKSGKPEQAQSIRQPVAVQQAIEEVQVSTSGFMPRYGVQADLSANCCRQTLKPGLMKPWRLQ